MADELLCHCRLHGTSWAPAKLAPSGSWTVRRQLAVSRGFPPKCRLPAGIGLAENVVLRTDIRRDAPIAFTDVRIPGGRADFEMYAAAVAASFPMVC
jgi:hypothetical protein